MEDGIESPPYPGGTTTGTSLYRHLAALRLWYETQVAILKQMVPPRYGTQLIEADNLAAETVWDHVSVVDKYSTLMYMRRIRESWDHVVREHETTWDEKLALKRRFSIVLMCQHILKEAFIDPELREAREQSAIDKAQYEMKIMNDHLRKVLIPPELQDQVTPEQAKENDDEGWFTPDTGGDEPVD